MNRADNLKLIMSAVLEWRDTDIALLAEVVSLGSPTNLRDNPPIVPTEWDNGEPEPVRAMRRLGGVDESRRAELLHLYLQLGLSRVHVKRAP